MSNPMAKRLFYVSAAILCLALAHHLGARNAGAQGGGQIVAATHSQDGGGWHHPVAITSSGDVYRSSNSDGTNWQLIGNVFTGSPIPAQQESFGSVKARYR
jgi:hypothetical protein